MPFRAGHIYPLNDPEHYNDDFGVGYDHAMIAHDAVPGDCYIHDAWIVNSAGQTHPGFDACPIPIRQEDVKMARGRHLDVALPVPKTIFDSSFAIG